MFGNASACNATCTAILAIRSATSLYFADTVPTLCMYCARRLSMCVRRSCPCFLYHVVPRRLTSLELHSGYSVCTSYPAPYHSPCSRTPKQADSLGAFAFQGFAPPATWTTCWLFCTPSDGTRWIKEEWWISSCHSGLAISCLRTGRRSCLSQSSGESTQCIAVGTSRSCTAQEIDVIARSRLRARQTTARLSGALFGSVFYFGRKHSWSLGRLTC